MIQSVLYLLLALSTFCAAPDTGYTADDQFSAISSSQTGVPDSYKTSDPESDDEYSPANEPLAVIPAEVFHVYGIISLSPAKQFIRTCPIRAPPSRLA